MQFFVDRDTVRMLLSQKEAAQLSLCPQPDCNDPKVCENFKSPAPAGTVSSGRSIPKGEFSVSVCSREQEMEITLTRLGAAQGQRQGVALLGKRADDTRVYLPASAAMPSDERVADGKQSVRNDRERRSEQLLIV